MIGDGVCAVNKSTVRFFFSLFYLRVYCYCCEINILFFVYPYTIPEIYWHFANCRALNIDIENQKLVKQLKRPKSYWKKWSFLGQLRAFRWLFIMWLFSRKNVLEKMFGQKMSNQMQQRHSKMSEITKMQEVMMKYNIKLEIVFIIDPRLNPNLKKYFPHIFFFNIRNPQCTFFL